MPNALAPKPKNSFSQFQYADPMMNQVPSANWEQQLVASKPEGYTLGQWINELQQGLQRGVADAEIGNMQFAKDVVTRPRGVYQDLMQSAKAVMRDPSIAVNALHGLKNQAVSGPYGFGQAVGGFLNPRGLLKPKGVMSELDVYHGTPHTLPPEPGAPLGRFRSEKIGTGEGAQAYGHGLYFAESPGVGGGYQANLSYREMVKKFRDVMPDDADTSDALDWANSGKASPEMAAVIKALADDDWLGFDYPSQSLTALFKEPGSFEISDQLKKAADAVRGNLYKVDLPDAKIEQMLDWNQTLNSQPAIVAKLQAAAAAPGPNSQTAKQILSRYNQAVQSFGENKIKGEHFYDSFVVDAAGSPEKASQFLSSLGIPGVRYLDAKSRKAGQGTRNFVVFPGEEKNLTVLERNGQKPVQAPVEPRVATYFSGGGTVESALPKHVRVFAAENNPVINRHGNQTHGTNFEPRDVNNIDPQELKDANVDLFHASPVCKNFSAAKTMRGADELDRRSAESVAKAIRVATPPVVTIENVASYADTALFKHITDALDAKGYKWDVVIHDAADFGTPQSRKRMLLRAVREGDLPPVPPKTGGKDWFNAVSDLLSTAPVSVIPPIERQRLNDMISSGRLDPTKPIITMGGSGFRNTWAAANSGGVAPTLKAAKEKPRIIMPDGTVSEVTNRMMARLMGLGDDVPVPDNPALAKTVLGNGISGDVTRNLITPLLNRPKR